MSDRAARALAQIDLVHGEDPSRTEDGRPRELVYAERMSSWLDRIAEESSEALRIAVRAQHLGRWRSPRGAYPAGRAGYLTWRKEAGAQHAADVHEILLGVGYDGTFAARVAALVMKKDRTRDPEAQLLEDCACLVFLDLDYAVFAAKHDDAKVVNILKKTITKMSRNAQAHAQTMGFSGRAERLLADALRPDR